MVNVLYMDEEWGNEKVTERRQIQVGDGEGLEKMKLGERSQGKCIFSLI